MRINIKDLKELTAKLNLAVEKSKINPKSGWIELETIEGRLSLKVSNYDYYFETNIEIGENFEQEEQGFHVTVLAETFIPLIAKLEDEYVEVEEKMNALVLETSQSSYTFPIIKELGKTKTIDKISFEKTSGESIHINGYDLATVSTINAKGLIDAVFSKEIQQFIYVDERGALTFTENMYVNDFDMQASGQFKMLLNGSQAKLLETFKDESDVLIDFERKPTFGAQETLTNKVRIYNNRISLVLIAQNMDMTDKFPSIRLRALADNPEQTHIIIDKKTLDKALARLMVFDKKFDITVMDYSKIVFEEDHLELVSIKNKNFEKIPYVSSQNVVKHESIIRFADLVKQLKALTSKEIDISYGSRPAITINGNCKQVIPEIVAKTM